LKLGEHKPLRKLATDDRMRTSRRSQQIGTLPLYVSAEPNRIVVPQSGAWGSSWPTGVLMQGPPTLYACDWSQFFLIFEPRPVTKGTTYKEATSI